MNFRIGSIAAGCGLHLWGLKQLGGIPVWAIEMDEAIAQCYRNNHPGRLYVKRVQDVDHHEVPDIDCLTITLSCKNASRSKGKFRGERIDDYGAAYATSCIIASKQPQIVLLENVWQYRNPRDNWEKRQIAKRENIPESNLQKSGDGWICC